MSESDWVWCRLSLCHLKFIQCNFNFYQSSKKKRKRKKEKEKERCNLCLLGIIIYESWILWCFLHLLNSRMHNHCINWQSNGKIWGCYLQSWMNSAFSVSQMFQSELMNGKGMDRGRHIHVAVIKHTLFSSVHFISDHKTAGMFFIGLLNNSLLLWKSQVFSTWTMRCHVFEKLSLIYQPSHTMQLKNYIKPLLASPSSSYFRWKEWLMTMEPLLSGCLPVSKWGEGWGWTLMQFLNQFCSRTHHCGSALSILLIPSR